MDIQQLSGTAQTLVTSGKGILAADESTGTMQRRFDSLGAEATEENRRGYRQLLFETDRIADYISGVILYDETIRQKSSEGTPLVEMLTSKGIIPGIKVDAGAKPLAGASGEMVTEGLDGLRERVAEYRELGMRFTKWRAVIAIGDAIPSQYCIDANAHALARFAALSQEGGLVPIVEPEILMDGRHDIGQCFDATEATLRAVFAELVNQRVDLEGTLLKPNMVLSGKDADERVGPEEVAERTITCFKRTIPASVPGIVFLSGGQKDDEATVNLDAINQQARNVGVPWELSFSYGRGLQAAPLKAWDGSSENVQQAQRAFQHRARVTSAARQGAYSPDMEGEFSAV